MIFNFFKNSELETISIKIKSINHKIIEKLNINETEKLSKLSQKNKDKRVEEIIESLSGQNFSKVIAYYFTFDELPMFKYLISLYENNYELSVSGTEDFKGFRCDYLLNENVFRLVLIKQEEHDKEENQLREILGKVSTPTYNVLKNYNSKKKETTKKAKKLVEEMISTTYLNEFSYNQINENKIENFSKKINEGVEEELLKVKSNSNKNPFENHLVEEKHISLMGWTVACWMLTVENEKKKMMPLKYMVKFCRLFLEQEKKRNYIKDYNRADVEMLKTCSLSCEMKTVEKYVKEKWTYKKAKDFEKEIGYSE